MQLMSMIFESVNFKFFKYCFAQVLPKGLQREAIIKEVNVKFAVRVGISRKLPGGMRRGRGGGGRLTFYLLIIPMIPNIPYNPNNLQIGGVVWDRLIPT